MGVVGGGGELVFLGGPDVDVVVVVLCGEDFAV